MSFKYVLDSSAWIEYLGGSTKGQKVHRLLSNEKVATSILAITELADKFARENRSFDTTLRFIQSNSAIIPLTISIGLRAAKVKKQFREKQSKFGLADAINFATALQENAHFVTADRDFADTENVILL